MARDADAAVRIRADRQTPKAPARQAPAPGQHPIGWTSPTPLGGSAAVALPTAQIPALQRLVGNQAVVQLLRPGGAEAETTGGYVQREIGSGAVVGSWVRRVVDKSLFKIVKAEGSGSKWAYRVQLPAGGKKHFARGTDKGWERAVGPAPAVANAAPQGAVVANPVPNPVVNQVANPVANQVANPVPVVAAPTPEETAAANLAKFPAVNLMDNASTGTGHQAAMVALLDNLAKLDYKGQVHLTYYRWKTKWWAAKLGAAPGGGADAYAKHTQAWAGRHKQLAVSCHPIGSGPTEYSRLLTAFLNVALPPGNTEQVFWDKIWWDGAAGCETAEIQRPTAFSNKKFVRGESEFTRLRSQITAWMLAWSVGEMSGSFGEALVNPPSIRTAANPDVPETLTMYAAFDSPDLSGNLVDVLKQMTGENDPMTVILQPFLWANAHHAGAQVLKGTTRTADVAHELGARDLVPAYPLQVPSDGTLSIHDFIEQRDPNARNKADVEALLTEAKAKSISLISAYYTQASAADVPYHKLVPVLIGALEHNELKSDKPTVIALLGGEASEAHTMAFDTLRARNEADKLVVGQPGILADLAALKGKIVLEHIGRTAAMPLFERYSTLFVSEGANTWQETLTVGKPTISARPSGETQPWVEDLELPAAADLVKRASEALVSLARTDKSGDALRSEPGMQALVDVIKAARDDQQNDLQRYFTKWSRVLTSPEGNQVVAALLKLP